MDSEKIKSNIDTLKKELGTEVRLVAVTKNVGVDEVKLLKSIGITDFGENRISVAEPKIREVNATWHFIGHLQTNKVKRAVELFQVIQSVDSITLARKIDSEAKKQDKKTRILIQLNIAREAQKQGFSEEEVEVALEEISKLENISVEGFMMMAPNIEPEQTRAFFKKTKQLFDNYKKKYNLTTLSMGMSGDYKIAVEEGSNMVRIGTKLFS